MGAIQPPRVTPSQPLPNPPFLGVVRPKLVLYFFCLPPCPFWPRLLNPKCALGCKMPAQPLLNPRSTPLFWVSVVPNWFCIFFVRRPVRFGPGCHWNWKATRQDQRDDQGQRSSAIVSKTCAHAAVSRLPLEFARGVRGWPSNGLGADCMCPCAAQPSPLSQGPCKLASTCPRALGLEASASYHKLAEDTPR